jgi:hypothetical protein
MNLPQDFRDLLAAFASAGVESVLVGGYAVAYHARPRATKDIDPPQDLVDADIRSRAED